MKNLNNYHLQEVILLIVFLFIGMQDYAQPLNNYLAFDGTEDYIDLGNSTDLKPTTELTVEVWAYNSDWATFDNARFISNTQSGGYNIQASGGILSALVQYNDYYYSQSISLATLSTGWHHFTVTCNGQYTRLYVDGILESTDNSIGVHPIQYSATPNNTFIGAEAGGGAVPSGSYFGGVMDEVRIWSVVRTETEIQDNMNLHLAGTETGLAGYWKLNETSGTTANDATANNNDGTLTNMTGNEWITIFSEVSNSLTDVYYSSVAWGDYDNDGYLDILLIGYDGAAALVSKIYRNDGSGNFIEQTGISLTGVHNYSSSSVAWGDYDNDGDLDILLTGDAGSSRISKIYKNNGDGTFSEQTGISLIGVCDGSVAWGDYDNDGDLDILLTGYVSSSTRISKIYKNDGNGGFTDSGISLPGVHYSSVAWGDYDNDGDLDILLTGHTGTSAVSKVYKNNGSGGFTDSGISLTGVNASSVAWGDYDNDGDLDILLTGDVGSGYVSKVYKNDGSDNFTEQTGISLTGVRWSSVAWGDYDNDGYLDILLTGDAGSGYVSKIYKNDGSGNFTEQTDISLTSVRYGSAAWGDYDNDADLDILITGYNFSSDDAVSKIYQNNNAVSNTSPNAPTNLSSSLSSSDITLSWDAATDNETPSAGLNYNIRVGTTPGGSDVVGPMANTSIGFRRVPALGNSNLNTSWTIKDFEGGGQFYWSVQTIDNTFSGSNFASEGSFSVTGMPDAIAGNALDFDGDNDYMDVPDDVSFSSNSFTAEFWLMPDVLRTQACYYKKSGGSLYWRFFMSGTSGSIEFDALPGEIANCRAENVAEAGKWIHIAATYDHTAQTVQLYANGILQETVTGIADMGGGSDKGLLLSNPAAPLDGKMDEVRLWNVVRTAEQIRENMHKTLTQSETGLVSYWQMNESSGTAAEDNYWINNGALVNMTDDDWIESTVATGGGISNTQIETSGVVAFTDTDLEMNFSSHNSASITVTKINIGPNSNPPHTTYDNQYWVVNRFGSGSFNASLTFTIGEDLTAYDENNPGQIKLYSRTSTSDGSWSLFASAVSVDAVANSATFNNISSFSQFILCREITFDDYPGTALDFDGINDYVETTLDDLSGSEITIEYWFKGTDTQSAVRQQAGSDYIVAGWDDLHILSNDGGVGNGIPVGSGAEDGNWHHIAMTWKQNTTNGFVSYLDGEIVGQRTSNDTPIPNIDANVFFGSLNGTTEFMTGSLEEIRIWNVVRDSVQIRENMHLSLSVAETGLVSYWQMNEGTGTSIYDYVSANDGILNNMDNSDWIASTIPFGGGEADSQTETAGVVNFTGTGLSMDFTSQSGAEITVARIDTVSNINPVGVDTVFDAQYWVVNRYGTGTFDADLTFNLSEDLTAADENYPSYLRLYTRGSTADTSWAFLTSASSVDAATDQVSFDGITSFSQFIIGKGLIPEIEVDIDTLNFGTVLINSNKTDSITISNTGSDTLFVNNISNNNTIFSCNITQCSILPESSFVVLITFTPTVEGSIIDTLIIYSNASNESEYTVILTGEVIGIDDYSGTALDFDGADDYVNIGNDASLDVDNTLTVEAWVKPDVLTSRYAIFSTRSGINSGEFQLEIGTGQGTNRVAVTGASTWVAQTGNNVISTGEWTHIAYTRTGNGSGTHNIYINGEIQQLVSDDPYPFVDNDDDKTIGSGNSGGELFNGQLEEVRIWNVARDSVQIRENMHLHLSGEFPGLVAYWQFNEGAGISTYDYVSGNNGTLHNMDNSDWVGSTIPFGGGVVDSQTETAGVVDFTGTGLSMDFYVQNGAEITVTRIDTVPNINPVGVDTVFNAQYWVIDRYGSGTFDTDLTFTLSEDLTVSDEIDPSNIGLFTRGSTADESWAFLTSASSVDAATDQVSFDGITSFSQFIIGKGKSPIIEVDIDTLDFETVLYGNNKTDTITISNTGADTLLVNNISNNYAEFSVNPIQCIIPPDSSYKVQITFTPTTLGSITDTLIIYSNAFNEPERSVILTGEGIELDNYPGTALDFDGTNDYVETTLDDLSGSEITIEYWFRGSEIQSAVRQQSGSNYIVAGYAQTPPSHILSNDGGGSGLPVGSAVEDGNWHHVAMSWKQNTVNGFVSYLDGKIAGQRTSSNTPLPNIDANVFFGSTNGGYQFMNGKLDEVRIWNVARTQEEIRENMHLSLSGTITGLVSYWQMNEGTGTSIYDYVSVNDGILNNMDNSDWIESTIPFGGGAADSQTETAGVVNFTGTGLSMDFDSQNGAEITVTRIDTLANINPTEPDEVFDTQYWVVNRYGTGTFAAYLTISLSEDLTTADEADPTQIKLYTRGSNADVEWIELASANSVDAANDRATFWGITSFSQFIIVRETEHIIEFDLTAFLEGPYNGTGMNPSTGSGFPLSQPYNTAPWNYSGSESVASIPANVVDWVLIELRDTTEAALATGETMIARQAAFLLNDGSVVGLDGTSILSFSHSIIHSLYVVIWHRNHPGIMSAYALTESEGVYSYDFTTPAGQAYGADAQKDMGSGIYGLYSGNANADATINTDDKTIWTIQAGALGYKSADFNMDGQVNNADKNDQWVPNEGEGSQVP